ncbi:MAG: branched-chain amino acid transporter permease [Oscillospiraceae bacterium]|nr:branched-chain amino acid transporter permease [Oscillospiraceae bacterium]MBQ5323695.1 branched-chain amino acid transporter permease [Oscillospiraceae bacterium]
MILQQEIFTIAMCVLATLITRFLPFVLFSGKKETPKFIEYLGKALPAAIFALLVVYCLKNVDITSGSYGIPEAISVAVVTALHLWKRKILLSMAGGTFCYMILVQLFF